MANKEKVYLISILFFLTFIQHLNIEQLWGVDFLLVGLLVFSYFVDIFWLVSVSVVIILLNLFISGQFHFLAVLGYIFIPFFTKRTSFVLNLNFPKYFLLCTGFLFIYILLSYLRFGIKTFVIIYFKNLIVSCLIYLLFRQVVSRSS